MTNDCAFDRAMQVAAGHPANTPGLRQAVPFFGVRDIERSLRFYVDGLGFQVIRAWCPDGPRVRWCWIEREGVAFMLQEYWRDGAPGGGPEGALGRGLSVCVFCADAIALYHEARARGLAPERPQVGNGLWVTGLSDPDGYQLVFESPTDAPEDSVHTDAVDD